MQTCGVVASVEKFVLLLCFLLQLFGEKRNVATAQTGEPEPYLLFTTQNSIQRLYLNGSTPPQILLGPTPGLIRKIDYHYRMNYMFWLDGSRARGRLMRARLNGSDVTTLLDRLTDPVDLAVDWLNNKLYWVDATLRLIEEYDISTGSRKFVASTGSATTSRPSAMSLYPYPNYGWLYWSDTTNRSIQMVSVTDDRRSIIHTNNPCVNALSIHYWSHTLYWIDTCTYAFESLRLDGDSSTHSSPFSEIISFSTALQVYNGKVYYAEGDGVFEADPDGETGRRQLYSTAQTRATGIKVVHPSRQPSSAEYIQIVTTVGDDFTFECSGECANGNCIPPGLCACNSGWRGELCDIDIPECSEVNGGCEHSCEERGGGFRCTCFDGYVLTYDGRTCVDKCRTEIVTANAARPASATFDPCLIYIPPTVTTTRVVYSTSVVATPTSVEASPTASPTSSPSSSYIEPLVSTTTPVATPPPSTTMPVATPPPSTTMPVATPPPSTTTPVATPSPSTTMTRVIMQPTPGIVEAVEKEEAEDEGIFLGFGLYVLIGIGAGLALSLIFVVIALVIIIVLCVRYKRRRNRSWSPQKSFRSNSKTHIDTMVSVKPSNGHSNGKVITLSKAEEANLEQF